MNSTSLSRRFYAEHVIPLLGVITNDNLHLSRDRSIEDSETFFISDDFGPDFSSASLHDISDRFHECWSYRRSDVVLLPLISPLIELARQLDRNDHGEGKVVSETSYVMY